MGFFNKLFGKKQKQDDLTDEDLIEAGACPNCWGIQKYGDQFQTYYKDQTKSNINSDKQHQKAFVSQFVETHITGIRLKKDGDNLVCAGCSNKYGKKYA